MEELIGALDKISDFFGSFNIEGMDHMIDGLDDLFGAMQDIGSAVDGVSDIGEALEELKNGSMGVFGEDGLISTVGNAVGSIAEHISELSGLFAEGGLFAGITLEAAAPFIAIAAAAAALAAGLGYVFSTNEEVRESFFAAAGTIKEGLQPAIEFITGKLIPDLQAGWERFLEILTPVGEFLEHAFTSIWQDMINPALEYIGSTVLPILTEAFENLWNHVLVPLGEMLGNIFAPVLEVVSNVLFLLWDNVVVPLADAVGGILAKAFEGLVPVFNYLIEHIKPVIKVFQFLWDNVLSPLISNLCNVLKPVVETVFGAIGKIIGSLKTVFCGLIDFVSGIFSGNFEKALEGVKQIFGGILNAMISIAELVVNSIINGINFFTSGFRDIVSAVGDIIGINLTIPDIPQVQLKRFESGGFPNTGELFLARENGLTEMVGSIGSRTTVANNDQIVMGIQNGVENALGRALSPYLDLIARNTQATAHNTSGGLKAAVHIDGRELVSAYDARKIRNGYSFT